MEINGFNRYMFCARQSWNEEWIHIYDSYCGVTLFFPDIHIMMKI